MSLAALSVDMQVTQNSAKKGKPTKSTLEKDVNAADGGGTVSEDNEHEVALSKQRHIPVLTDEDDDSETSSTRATTPVHDSEPGSEWETVATRIDRQFPGTIRCEH